MTSTFVIYTQPQARKLPPLQPELYLCSGIQLTRPMDGWMDWTGLEWTGVEWSGVEWSGVEWSGVEWSGVEWSGVEWSGTTHTRKCTNSLLEQSSDDDDDRKKAEAKLRIENERYLRAHPELRDLINGFVKTVVLVFLNPIEFLDPFYRNGQKLCGHLQQDCIARLGGPITQYIKNVKGHCRISWGTIEFTRNHLLTSVPH
eukprot:gene1811-4911_t